MYGYVNICTKAVNSLFSFWFDLDFLAKPIQCRSNLDLILAMLNPSVRHYQIDTGLLEVLHHHWLGDNLLPNLKVRGLNFRFYAVSEGWLWFRDASAQYDWCCTTFCTAFICICWWKCASETWVLPGPTYNQTGDFPGPSWLTSWGQNARSVLPNDYKLHWKTLGVEDVQKLRYWQVSSHELKADKSE